MAGQDVIRIPNLPTGQMTDENGNATDDEYTFRQILITSLQTNFGNEGVVVPTQSYANMLIIQNHQIPNPITGVVNVYTCQFGTILFVTGFGGTPGHDVPVICVPDGSGNPLFKEMVLL